VIRVLVPVLGALAAVFGTHVLAETVKVRLRLAWHRRLTRRHNQMLRRALVAPRGEGWR
jgi:hypothetical protein